MAWIDWSLVLFHLERLAAAYVLALPVGWERERHERSAGVRTFPLVAIASCGYTLIAGTQFPNSPEAQVRVLSGVITGIGFIGGGAILKYGATVRGTATAASIWATGAIGASVGFERHEIALILSIMTFATLRFLAPFKRDGDGEARPPERAGEKLDDDDGWKPPSGD